MFIKYKEPQRNEKFKKELIRLRGHQCEVCGKEKWLDQPINLELHHIDGDRANCLEDNLQLLCPNCHSYTDTYCLSTISKKSLQISDEEFVFALQNNPSIRQALLSLGISDTGANYQRAKQIIQKYSLDIKPHKKSYNYCIDCGVVIGDYASRCVKCENINRMSYRISRQELKDLIRTIPFTQIGNKFGVSDNAIRKWCDKYGLPRSANQIKSYTDEEWEKI